MDDKQKVLYLLMTNEDEWLKAGFLARHIGDDRPTRPALRKIVRELVLEGEPIITGSRGFMYTREPYEVMHAAIALYRRADLVRRRADALVATCVKLCKA